jgi:hypothetical protein
VVNADMGSNTTFDLIGAADTDGDSKNYQGYLCNIGVWSRAITQTDIKSIMNKNYAGLTSSEKTNLVSWWNLDSVIDSADSGDGDTTVYDNHHGGGDTLGSELITNSTFDTDSDWTLGTGWNISDGTLNQVGNTDFANSTTAPVIGQTYQVKYSITSYTSGTNYITFGGSYLAHSESAVGDFTYIITAASTVKFGFYSSSGVYSIDNVSIKLINGNTGTLS